MPIVASSLIYHVFLSKFHFYRLLLGKNAIVLYLNFEGRVQADESLHVRIAWSKGSFSEKNRWRNNSFKQTRLNYA